MRNSRRVSLYAFARARVTGVLKALLISALAAVPLLLAGASVASTPPTSTITVPTSGGQTVSSTWTGTIPAGANPTSSCVGFEAISDKHEVTVNVAAGTYDTVDAAFKFTITWADATHDEILTVLDPQGEEIDSSDGGTNVETVNANSLPAGKYTVLACPFAAALPVTYTGKLEITTTARSSEPSLPSAPAQGLAFSASVASDNQRDQAEPLLEIDKAGNVYDCGPTGFSNASDYAQVSPVTQGGDQFHLLGTPPRGQQGAGGGGDCGLAFGTKKNPQGHYQYAYTGLGPLTGFVTSTSPNSGRSIATGGPFANGVTDEGGGADRQWMTFVGEQEVLLIYNQQVPRNVVVQRSTDGGLTYGPDAVRAARNPRFPGPIRYIEPTADLPNGLVYFPWDRGAPTGNQINISFSTDKGLTWRNCGGAIAPGTTTLFVTADHDSAGNIYLVYGENAKFHTYMITTSAQKLIGGGCPDPTTTTNLPPLRSDLFTPPVQVDRDNVRSTVFQWVTAGTEPGRVAVVFAGTETDGNPNVGTFKATWNIYVNQSLNALASDATFSQVKATTHPFHYDSICLNGLGCDLAVPPGDRSMADFFALDYNPVDKRIYVTFNRSNKKPDEAVGHVASPMVITQIAGPSLGGGTVSVANREPLRTSSVDKTGDALSGYSFLAPGPLAPSETLSPQTNEPAGDFLSATIGPELDLVDNSEVTNGGFTVTLKVANLSDAELLNTMTRTGSQSLLWIWRFTNGYQDAAAAARWNPVQGFTYGFNDYTTGAAPCIAGETNGDKCILYPGDQPIQGHVDQETGTIRLSVPRFLLRALDGSEGPGQRPSEVAATAGSRLYDGTAFSLGNTISPVQTLQAFLYPLDNTPSFDFLIPAGGGGGGGEVACKITGGGTIPSGKFSLNVHVGTPPKGSVSYRDSTTDFNSTSLLSALCSSPSKAEIRGIGKDGDTTVNFTLEVVDGGEASTSDSFSLTMSQGGSRSGTLTKGNIQIHKR